MPRRLIPLLAMALLPSILAAALAATVDASNYTMLQQLLAATIGNVDIRSDGARIYIVNLNSSREAILVFKELPYIEIQGLRGAHVGVWNGSHIALKTPSTSYDVVVYASGEIVGDDSKISSGGALALVIPPGGMATIARIEFSSSEERLSAPAPPPGFTIVNQRSGSGEARWTVTLPSSGTVWVAFRECSASTCDYDLHVYDGSNLVAMLFGLDTRWETRTVDVSSRSVGLWVEEWAGGGQTWQVILAYKGSGSGSTPTPQPQPPGNPDNPSAPVPGGDGSSNDTGKWLLLGIGALAVLLLFAVLAARR